MRMPGEIPQEIGRAYATVLTGCLDRTVSYFTQQFDVTSAPKKLTFHGNSISFSFDTAGTYGDPAQPREVFVEAKGYKNGSGLLKEYRDFLVKSYAATVFNYRHYSDLFFFLTNVPFGSSQGVNLTSTKFIKEVLEDSDNEKVQAILGPSLHIEDRWVASLSERVAIGIFPDSYIRWMGLKYIVKQDENLWDILQFLHAYQPLGPAYEPIVARVAKMNELKNADFIDVGQELHLPWNGIIWEDSEDENTQPANEDS